MCFGQMKMVHVGNLISGTEKLNPMSETKMKGVKGKEIIYGIHRINTVYDEVTCNYNDIYIYSA